VIVTVRAIITAAVALLFSTACAQEKTEEPARTTLCELLKTPERFNGKMVQIRATMKSEFEWGGLTDGGCISLLSTDGLPALGEYPGEFAFLKSFADLENPEKLIWKPIRLPPQAQMSENSSYRALKKHLYRKWKRADGNVCPECPLFSITVTVTGRFDHLEEKLVEIRANRDEVPRRYIAGFGHLNASPNRLVWQSVSDVVATPIDVTIYEKRKVSRE
jgi:hypothetical protein